MDTGGNWGPSWHRILLLLGLKSMVLADCHEWCFKAVHCRCMLFGMCNASATIQRLMQNCLGEVNLTYCLIYLNDVIVFSKMKEEHLHHLCIVFECFREHNLKFKLTIVNSLGMRSIIWLIMSPRKVHDPARRTWKLWLNSLHLKPVLQSNPFWAWWDIMDSLLRVHMHHATTTWASVWRRCW